MQFTDAQIIEAMTGLLSPMADKNSPVLLRSDIAPHVAGKTGCWVDPDVEGDKHGSKEDYIGIGFIIIDAVDADTGEPFITAIKVHKPSFNAAPKAYAMGLALNMSKAIGKMQGEMHETARRQARRIKAQVESGKSDPLGKIH